MELKRMPAAAKVGVAAIGAAAPAHAR